jgi:mono/diheme cytochrome c family protein
MKTHRLAVIVFPAVLALASAAAQTPSPDASLTGNPVYTKDCAKCHGKTAEGRHFAGPSLISEKAAAASADDLRNIIAHGKGHMPKFAGKLSADEIDALAKQIQTANKK